MAIRKPKMQKVKVVKPKKLHLKKAKVKTLKSTKGTASLTKLY